ncbi:MAG TPA: capsule assembly Wzi family protein, partial [Steroidobacteraceae bacterium]|nr:capsule assembly Wzi family protein [Steroidobacteraceae bacterium]
MTPHSGQWRVRPALLRALVLLGLLITARAQAGVSAYLPLSLAPEIESRVERLLVLAGVPVMTRPIRVATVVEALASACRTNKSLCRQVRRDIAPYLAPIQLTGLGVEVAATQSNALTQPNQHGAPMDSSWLAYASGIARFNPYALLSVGAVGNSDRVTPTGTMASVGWDAAQLDVGYRDHWWSPFRLGSMLISTEAATMPSVTVSSVVPLTIAHLRYELFMGRMSHSDRIEFNGGYTSGNPQLFGFHIDLEPAPGWTLGVSRIMQYGGGDRPSGFRDLMKAFFNPASYDNFNAAAGSNQEFGNEQVAFSSEFVVPVRFPMSAYIEYAAEDTFHSENYRFGSSALSAGLYLPRLRPNLQLRYEFSEWQSNWYVHHIYRDGMTNYGVVLGQWGAQWRHPGDGVGAQSHALELIWDRRGGRQLDLQYRTALNASYTGGNYQRGQELAISVSRPWRTLQVGARVDGGRDEYGDKFGRLAAFARFAGPSASSRYAEMTEDADSDNETGDATKEALAAQSR